MNRGLAGGLRVVVEVLAVLGPLHGADALLDQFGPFLSRDVKKEDLLTVDIAGSDEAPVRGQR